MVMLDNSSTTIQIGNLPNDKAVSRHQADVQTHTGGRALQ